MSDLLLPTTASDPLPAHEQIASAFLLRFRNQLTVRGYARSLRQWFDFCAANQIVPLEARRIHIETWMRTCELAGNKPSTVAAKLNAVVGFYRYAFLEDVIDKNPAVHVDRPKIPRESSRNGRFWLLYEHMRAHGVDPRTLDALTSRWALVDFHHRQFPLCDLGGQP